MGNIVWLLKVVWLFEAKPAYPRLFLLPIRTSIVWIPRPGDIHKYSSNCIIYQGFCFLRLHVFLFPPGKVIIRRDRHFIMQKRREREKRYLPCQIRRMSVRPKFFSFLLSSLDPWEDDGGKNIAVNSSLLFPRTNVWSRHQRTDWGISLSLLIYILPIALL